MEDLVGSNGTKKRGTGPTGKMKQLFEAASSSRAASNKSLPLCWRPSSISMPLGEGCLTVEPVFEETEIRLFTSLFA